MVKVWLLTVTLFHMNGLTGPTTETYVEKAAMFNMSAKHFVSADACVKRAKEVQHNMKDFRQASCQAVMISK